MIELFVYGSLREGMYNYNHYLKGKSKKLQMAYVYGSLYTIQGVRYPALIEGCDKITGEIYEVSPEVLKSIDELEGCLCENSMDNEYHKVLCTVYNEDDSVHKQLPIYVYNIDNPQQKLRLGKRITSGDFIQYQKENW